MNEFARPTARPPTRKTLRHPAELVASGLASAEKLAMLEDVAWDGAAMV